MKTGNYQGHQRTLDAYQKFKSLWKTDDESWVAARKAAFKAGIYGNDGGPDGLFLGKFYVYGEEPPGYVGEDASQGQDIALILLSVSPIRRLKLLSR